MLSSLKGRYPLGVHLRKLNFQPRDVQDVVDNFTSNLAQAVGVVMQFWFWLTPIVYVIDVVPERLIPLFTSNPMFALMTGYQRIVVASALPDWRSLAPSAVTALLLSLIGWGVFRRLSADVLDEI